MGVYSDQLEAIAANVAAADIQVGNPPQTLVCTSDPTEIIQGRVALLVIIQGLAYVGMCGDGTPDIAGLLVGVAADPAMLDLLEIVDQVAGLVGANLVTRATWTPPGADSLPCFNLTAT